jgi:hypothetical protein
MSTTANSVDDVARAPRHSEEVSVALIGKQPPNQTMECYCPAPLQEPGVAEGKAIVTAALSVNDVAT